MQTDMRWGDISGNLSRAERLIAALPETDLIVLPEMFATGFCPLPCDVAEDSGGGEVLEWMRRMAKARDAAVVGSVAVRAGVAGIDAGGSVGAGVRAGRVADGSTARQDGNVAAMNMAAGYTYVVEDDTAYRGKFYNRLYFVMPDGTFEWYDKRHLFGYGGEGNEYLEGRRRLVVEYRGVRIMPLVCYDLRFPVWSRNRGDYDMLLYVANWPSGRIAAWDILLKARAVENLCYAVGVNRVGSDPQCCYNGHSVVAGPRGGVIAECREGVEEGITAELDIEALGEYRRRFPALEDADRFEIK